MRLSGSQSSAHNAQTSLGFLSDHEKTLQIVKWVIYGLLFINFGLYLAKDITAALHTITDKTTVIGWLTAFAASMDQFAWVMLIFIYEIETYWLEDDYDNALVLGAMTAFKLLFAAMILNTVVAYASLVLELDKVSVASPAGGLCALADQGYAFLRNLAYTSVTTETCTSISYAGEVLRYPKDPVLTDNAGLRLDSWYRILDLVEAAAWFAILGFTELSVRLLNKGIYKGALTAFEKYGKYVCYALLVGVSVFWLANMQFMYVWDELLWIASFMLLEMNMSAWRAELAAQHEDRPAHDGATQGVGP